MRVETRVKSRSKKGFEPSTGLSSACSEAVNLNSPPGIATNETVAPPPGLEGFSKIIGKTNDVKNAISAVAKVRIRGLPKALLSDVMLEAILDQANLESEVVDHTIKAGSTCGEVEVSFSSHSAAQQCVKHFEGCRWNTSGSPVKCSLIAAQRDPVSEKMERLPEPIRIPVAPWLLSAKVPNIEPMVLPAPNLLSPEAPVFVPIGGHRHEEAKKVHIASIIARSEISTDEDASHCVSEDEVAHQGM